MTPIVLVGFVILVASASGQRHHRPTFPDYDYQDAPTVRQASPARAVAPNPKYATPVAPKPTPVPILKQINRHNNDGSYTYGYEGADGSFKIETKLPTGEVMGKYGYIDDTGKLRVIDYGANRYGFQPAGEGITVAPPTLVDETTGKDGKGTFADYDDESAYNIQPQPRAPQRRPEVFVPRPPQIPARTYTGFQEERRATPATPIYEDVQATFAAAPTPAPAPAPARFAPPPTPSAFRFTPAVAPSPARFAPAPARRPAQARFIPQPVPASPGPVPPRAAIPNAVPVGPVGPIYRHDVSPAPRPAPVREHQSAKPTGILLDHLAKQFALPDGAGQPLHDIVFGSYSSRTTF